MLYVLFLVDANQAIFQAKQYLGTDLNNWNETTSTSDGSCALICSSLYRRVKV